tara:strand:- start:123 stop:266 length:144 start_codon:yes stop_codon:yes gene_type:complete
MEETEIGRFYTYSSDSGERLDAGILALQQKVDVYERIAFIAEVTGRK